MVGGALKLIFGWAQQKVSSTTLSSLFDINFPS